MTVSAVREWKAVWIIHPYFYSSINIRASQHSLGKLDNGLMMCVSSLCNQAQFHPAQSHSLFEQFRFIFSRFCFFRNIIKVQLCSVKAASCLFIYILLSFLLVCLSSSHTVLWVIRTQPRTLAAREAPPGFFFFFFDN